MIDYNSIDMRSIRAFCYTTDKGDKSSIHWVQCKYIRVRIEELLELHSPEDVLEIIKKELS